MVTDGSPPPHPADVYTGSVVAAHGTHWVIVGFVRFTADAIYWLAVPWATPLPATVQLISTPNPADFIDPETLTASSP